MSVIAKDLEVVNPQPKTYSTYLEEPTPQAQEQKTHAAKPTSRPPSRTSSLLALADLFARTQPPELRDQPELSEATGACGALLGNLRHFNRLAWTRAALTHCDFHSVPLPELRLAWHSILAAQCEWVEAIGSDANPNELAEITYAEVDYPARPRKYLDIEVRIDPKATRVARVYTDEDAEVWGP
jgi:hypothetical protein